MSRKKYRTRGAQIRYLSPSLTGLQNIADLRVYDIVGAEYRSEVLQPTQALAELKNNIIANPCKLKIHS